MSAPKDDINLIQEITHSGYTVSFLGSFIGCKPMAQIKATYPNGEDVYWCKGDDTESLFADIRRVWEKLK